jgi:hypothetical protein
VTNEEIQKAVDAVLDGDWREYYGPTENEGVDTGKLSTLLEQTMRGLALKAYEGAARAQCCLCNFGMVTELALGGQWPPLADYGGFDDDEDIYIHRADGTRAYRDSICKASLIHTLKDSLNAVTADV